jgi:hypothetical protein
LKTYEQSEKSSWKKTVKNREFQTVKNFIDSFFDESLRRKSAGANAGTPKNLNFPPTTEYLTCDNETTANRRRNVPSNRAEQVD